MEDAIYNFDVAVLVAIFDNADILRVISQPVWVALAEDLDKLVREFGEGPAG